MNVTTLSLSSSDVFRLDGSLWTGEAALKPEDLDPTVTGRVPVYVDVKSLQL